MRDSGAVSDAAMAGGSDRSRGPDAEPASSAAVTPERGSTRRRRRVVALSARDQERVARGDNPEDLARADYEHDALSGQGGGFDAPETGAASSNDSRLKRDVPPHWG